MKAQKCPKCGELSKIWKKRCDNCNYLFKYEDELVEIIDWEYELITNNETK